MKGKSRLADFRHFEEHFQEKHDCRLHVQTRQPLAATLESFCFADHFTLCRAIDAQAAMKHRRLAADGTSARVLSEADVPSAAKRVTLSF